MSQLNELLPTRSDLLANAGLRCVLECTNTTSSGAIEHLTHGAGRRLGLLQHSLQNVFRLLPPTAAVPLERDALNDVQVNLHAFFINLVGLFDNLAWVFAHHHGLSQFLSKPLSVGLFKSDFQKHLPTPLRELIGSEELSNWHKTYLKNYRDALAHQIPLYVAPSVIYERDRNDYDALEAERAKLEQEWQFDLAADVREQQTKLEHPCFSFIHSFAPGASIGHVYVHPQLLADAFTATSVTNAFFDSWQAQA
ncbi:hypothetical protein [Cognatilysobacter terrigena]|uniref:hypothetical protein n=1 Tax=Cognatilysobacter terrigena TaxID=2488749 RepID=UPI001060C5BD|nr:hypothetical protein [Lysobacter terrigena]